MPYSLRLTAGDDPARDGPELHSKSFIGLKCNRHPAPGGTDDPERWQC